MTFRPRCRLSLWLCIYTLAELRIRDFNSRSRWMLLGHLDQHTHLFNKATAEQLFRNRLARAASGERCALLLLDLDDFKQINDSLGHAKGNVVLQETAEAIRACLGAGDIAGRFGGDEVILLLTDIPQAKAARLRALCVARGQRPGCAGLRPSNRLRPVPYDPLAVCAHKGARRIFCAGPKRVKTQHVKKAAQAASAHQQRVTIRASPLDFRLGPQRP